MKIRNPMANAFFPAPFALENYQDRCTAARYGFQPLPRRDWRFKSEPSRVPRVDKIVIVGATQEAVVPAAASEPIEADVLCRHKKMVLHHGTICVIALHVGSDRFAI